MYTNIAFAMAFMGPLVLGLLLGLYHKKIIPVVAVVGILVCYVLAIPVIGSVDTRAAETAAMNARQAARMAKVVGFKTVLDFQSDSDVKAQPLEVSLRALSVYKGTDFDGEVFAFYDADRDEGVEIKLLYPGERFGRAGAPVRSERVGQALVETYFSPAIHRYRTQGSPGINEPARYMVGVTVPVQSAPSLRAHCFGSTLHPRTAAELRAVCLSLTARALPDGMAIP